ncbi:hypothetical protein BDF21DRAFT_493297 [Thamnidium elegans]|nr:hypothetical protein BDF21DRAFT_493297 [Thamnidium elegans]
MGLLTDTIPPPPPYTPHETSSSHSHPTRLYTSDYSPLPTAPNLSSFSFPATLNVIIPTVTIRTPPTPFTYNKQDARQTITSLLSESHKNKSGSRFLIKQCKQPLVLYETWSGHTCQLHNRQETILVHGSVIAYDTIRLENKKGNIIVDGSIVSSKDISVKIIQGTLVVHGICMAAKNIMTVEASHSPLQLQCLMEAKRLYVKMKHAPLVLNQVSVMQTLGIRATKASIEIYIVDIKNNSAKIDIETSHAFVTVYLPRQFSGEFNIESKKGIVSIINRSQIGILDYKRTEQSHIEGSFKHGTHAKHSIRIKTSNAPATIHII